MRHEQHICVIYASLSTRTPLPPIRSHLCQASTYPTRFFMHTSGRLVPSRSSMHAMACLTADVRVPQSACRVFFSLGAKAQNTRLTARKRLFRATGVSYAEQPARLCSRKACSHRPRSPLAVLATNPTNQMGW